MGKAFYAWCIQRDKKIDGTYMRCTSIPEELGRVSYLLADKTGTVTKNEMSFKKFTLADTCYEENNFHEVRNSINLFTYCNFFLTIYSFIN